MWNFIIPGSEITIPSNDFPEKAGYVATDVNLMIKDIEQKNIDGRDVFVTQM